MSSTPTTDSTTTSSTSRVRIELYASQLKNVAGAFKGTSDPFAIVTLLANDPSEKPKVLGKTEVIKNTLNPRWVTSFECDYEFGKLTRFNVGIYDEVRKSSNNKPMGSAMFEVGECLGARGNTKAKKLRNGGTVYCRITPARTSTSTTNASSSQQQQGPPPTIQLGFRGIKLKNVDGMFGKSDPFFELNAQVSSAGGATWHPVYRSKHVDNNLNPTWENFEVPLDRLCGQDLDLQKPVQFNLFDWQKNGKHTPMGTFETNVFNLLRKVTTNASDTSNAFPVKKKGKEFGKIVVTTGKLLNYAPPSSSSPSSSDAAAGSGAAATAAAAASTTAAGGGFSQVLSSTETTRPSASAPTSSYSIAATAPLPPPMAPPSSSLSSAQQSDAAGSPRPSFVDYLTGGCELELCIAIDFTGSNGDPRRPGTLHYMHRDGQLNDYEKAITAVGGIIARYDSTQTFPVWGFGAKFGGVLKNCFQIGPTPELKGLSSVLNAYRNVFQSGLTMSGPTVFAEVISLAASAAMSRQEAAKRIGQQAYKILLILTDGAVSDVEQTKRVLHDASAAPLSVVIVGIGNADFGDMHLLDDFQDTMGGHQHRGRDICQFVEFNRYRNNRSALTQQVLAEIPHQLVEYFYSRGIKPLPPISGSQLNLNVDEPDEEDIDLSLDISPEGEISLANTTGAVYDDSKYDTISAFAPPAPAASNAYAPHHQAAAAPTQPYVPSSQPQPYVPGQASTTAGSAPPFNPGNYQTTAAAAPSYAQPAAAAAPAYAPSYAQPAAAAPAYAPSYAQPAAAAPSYAQPAAAAPSYAQPASSYPQNQPAGAYNPGYAPAQPYYTQQQQQPQAASGYSPSGGYVTAQPVPPQPRVFHVQVPPGVGPGTQLQVVNPVTQQTMLVVVPPGVPPGGKIAVQY